MFKILIKPSAEKRLSKFTPAEREKIIKAIGIINQRQNGGQALNIKRLARIKGKHFRIRLGNIRILYRVDEAKTAEIYDIDFRGNIY